MSDHTYTIAEIDELLEDQARYNLLQNEYSLLMEATKAIHNSDELRRAFIEKYGITQEQTIHKEKWGTFEGDTLAIIEYVWRKGFVATINAERQ